MRIYSFLFALLFSTATSAATLNKLVVFGDSLSDHGNLYEYMEHTLPQAPPYYHGRFTNGPAWIELLSISYFPQYSKTRLRNYAFGGSGVTDDESTPLSLHNQLDNYFVEDGKADGRSLYIVWIGANNYLKLPEPEEEPVAFTVGGIKNSLERLANQGAKHVLVVNLPDLGRTPAAHEMGVENQLSQYTTQHNQALKDMIAALARAHAKTQWIHYDVNALFRQIMADPHKYGFHDVTNTCYEAVMQPHTSMNLLNVVSSIRTESLNEDACDGFLFFDPVHPTEPAHVLMRDQIRALLEAKGIQFS